MADINNMEIVCSDIQTFYPLARLMKCLLNPQSFVEIKESDKQKYLTPLTSLPEWALPHISPLDEYLLKANASQSQNEKGFYQLLAYGKALYLHLEQESLLASRDALAIFLENDMPWPATLLATFVQAFVGTFQQLIDLPLESYSQFWSNSYWNFFGTVSYSELMSAYESQPFPERLFVSKLIITAASKQCDYKYFFSLRSIINRLVIPSISKIPRSCLQFAANFLKLPQIRKMYIRAFELTVPHIHYIYPLAVARFLESIYNLDQSLNCERDCCLSSCFVLSSKCVLVGQFVDPKITYKRQMRRLMLLLHSFAHYILETEGIWRRDKGDIEPTELSFRQKLERDFPIRAEGEVGNSVHRALFGRCIYRTSDSAAKFFLKMKGNVPLTKLHRKLAQAKLEVPFKLGKGLRIWPNENEDSLGHYQRKQMRAKYRKPPYPLK